MANDNVSKLTIIHTVCEFGDCSMVEQSAVLGPSKRNSVPVNPGWFTGTLLYVVKSAEIARKQFYSIIKLLKSISSKSLLGAS
jgi:hypothetical protein